jgi:hypothetical protein
MSSRYWDISRNRLHITTASIISTCGLLSQRTPECITLPHSCHSLPSLENGEIECRSCSNKLPDPATSSVTILCFLLPPPTLHPPISPRNTPPSQLHSQPYGGKNVRSQVWRAIHKAAGTKDTQSSSCLGAASFSMSTSTSAVLTSYIPGFHPYL